MYGGCNQRGSSAGAGRGGRSLAAGVAASNDDDIVWTVAALGIFQSEVG